MSSFNFNNARIVKVNGCNVKQLFIDGALIWQIKSDTAIAGLAIAGLAVAGRK